MGGDVSDRCRRKLYAKGPVSEPGGDLFIATPVATVVELLVVLVV